MSKAKRYTPGEKTVTPLTGLLLYLLPVPLLFAIIFSFFSANGVAVIKYAVGYALFLFAASVAKKGFAFERRYRNSALAKAPRFPYKTAGAILLAGATFYTSLFCTSNSLLMSLIAGASALLGFYLFYGFDPREDKVGHLRVGVRAEDVIAITDDAKKRIAALEAFKKDIPSKETRKHLNEIIQSTEEIIKNIETDPNDLDKARKFFKIYLDRTYKISDEFVTHVRKENLTEEIQQNYDNLLIALKKTIVEQKEKLESEDLTALDIQIEALTKQLNQEGV